MEERFASTGSVLDDRFDESYLQTFHPPNQLLDELDQSTYGLIAPLRDAARTMDPIVMLARAAQAFIFAATAAETTMDRAAAIVRGRAFADLAVTGRRAYAAFRLGVDRAALDAKTRAFVLADGGSDPNDDQVDAAVDQALDRAYAVAWALRGPAVQQAAWREPLGWVAVSSQDDKAHRPVNVPPPPYDQHEIAVACRGLVLQTRFFVATSEPPESAPLKPMPRDVPPDGRPTVPSDHEVILFLHGHSSGAEEAVDFIPYLLKEGARRGKKYAIVAFDLPSNGYSETVDHTSIAPTAATTYPRLPTDHGPIATPVLDFIEDFAVAFVDALDAVTPIKDRVTAVIGGSLGGNLGLRLGRRDRVNGTDTPWLKNSSIVAWSPASVWKPKVQHTVDYMAPDRCMQRADEQEYIGARANYFRQVYEEKELEGIIQPQPQYWYRSNWAPRAIHVDQSALARIDIYDSNYRRWHWRVAGEQLVYSHQDNTVHGDATTPVRYTQNTVRMLLMAGAEDNYIGTHIYDNTVAIGRVMTTPGQLLLVPETGHSIHFERPGVLARAIIDFLAGKSMEIMCTTSTAGQVDMVGGFNHTDGVPFQISVDDCMEAILAGDEFFVTTAAGGRARVIITSTTPRPSLGDRGGKNLGYYLSAVGEWPANVTDTLPVCGPVPTGPAASGDDMAAGEVLAPGQSISSADGRYTFVYQTDGNLVLYGPGGVPLWSSATNGRPPGVTIMQGDGNLVIYGTFGVAVWDSGTAGNPGARLVVQDDGNVVIYRSDGTAAWATNTVLPAGPAASGDDMAAGEVLVPGQSINSADGRFSFVYQTDGNLVLYGPGGAALWDSATNGRPVGVTIMQGDGNLVIYRPGEVPVWASGTVGNPGARLVVQDDGNVVIYRSDGTAAWATNTVLPAGPPASGDDMAAGEVLVPGQSISSADGRFSFVYQTDGNLVLYGPAGAYRWDSATNGRPVGVTIMQGDGNLVIYRPGEIPEWASNTAGNPGARLVVQDDGNVVIYRTDGTDAWATNTALPAGQAASGDDMAAGEVLVPDQSISSPDGRFTFVYQTDGNLVLYGPGGVALWASATSGRPAGVTIMQGDGNLVIYGPLGSYVWASNTAGNPGARLVVQDDGNVVIYRTDGTAAWATNTVLPAGPAASGDDMAAGEVLAPGQSINSADGRFSFVYHISGYLVLYAPNGNALWTSARSNRPAGVTIMQGDGNLVIYAPGEVPVWASNTAGYPGARLVVQDDGNVVIYKTDGTAAWATNTVTP